MQPVRQPVRWIDRWTLQVRMTERAHSHTKHETKSFPWSFSHFELTGNRPEKYPRFIVCIILIWNKVSLIFFHLSPHCIGGWVGCGNGSGKAITKFGIFPLGIQMTSPVDSVCCLLHEKCGKKTFSYLWTRYFIYHFVSKMHCINT